MQFFVDDVGFALIPKYRKDTILECIRSGKINKVLYDFNIDNGFRKVTSFLSLEKSGGRYLVHDERSNSNDWVSEDDSLKQ